MIFRTECPNCGTEGALKIVFLKASMEMPLTEEGFSLAEATLHETWDEQVQCSACEAEFILSDLVKEES